MPLNLVIEVEVFDVWGIDFIGLLPISRDFSYILLVVNYVSKWIEVIPTQTCDHKVVVDFVRNNNFSRFGVPHALVSDNGSHFCNMAFQSLLRNYGVTHQVSTPYHRQSNGQAEVSNRQIKQILETVVRPQRKDWVD
jgi:hypothetical protein